MTKARDLASSTLVPSTVSTTELGYVDGVTSAIQTQMDSKLATATAASTYQTKTQNGLIKIIPSSVAVGSGTGSVSASGTVTFSGASSVSVNGCFSSTYENYKIVLSSTHSASSYVGYSIRMRASGTDNTANYINNIIYSTNGGGPSRTYSTTSSGAFSVSGDIGTFTNIDISRPFAVASTGINSNYAGWASSNNEIGVSQILHNNGASYDGFTLFPASGTVLGTVSIYGYN